MTRVLRILGDIFAGIGIVTLLVGLLGAPFVLLPSAPAAALTVAWVLTAAVAALMWGLAAGPKGGGE